MTLLAKHLTKGVDLVTATYTQEPDSIIHYVRDDGKMICLTYIREQEVYGWSQWVTNGDFEYAVSIPNGQNDVLYVVVKRGDKRYIESFEPVASTNVITDYKMMDCHSVHTVTDNTISVPKLAGYNVPVTLGHLLNSAPNPPNPPRTPSRKVFLANGLIRSTSASPASI